MKQQTILIEKTSKQIKGRQLVAALLILVGTLMLLAGSSAGLVFIGIGILAAINARIQRWWHHE
jgi:hypothetical protein